MNAHEAFAEATPFAAEEPQPLVREIPPAAPYPVAALGPLRAAAEAIHDLTQAPAAIGAQSVLAAAALAVQALADVETLGGPAPCSLFAMTVAQSGERKSACDRLAMKPIRAFEAELAAEYKAEATAARNRLDLWTARRSAILRTCKDDPDGARADLDALGPEPSSPILPFVVAGDPTVEAIIKNFGTLRPSLGVFSEEGGALLGGSGFSAENRLRTVATFSAFWDGTPVNRWRAGDGVSSHCGRRLSAHLLAQPVAAAQLLADPIANGQGLVARFLLCEPESAIGTRLRDGCDPASEPALARFAERLGRLLRWPMPLRDGARNELEPPVLGLAPDARALLRAFHGEVERAQAAGGPLESARPFASKSAEHAARLATVMTLFADPAATTVSGEAMADGVSLATFYLGEAVRLAGAATVSTETAEAERLRRWLLESWREPFVSATDAAQRGPIRETDKARKALATLARHGWVAACADGATILGKRRREAWTIRGRVAP